MPFKARPAPLSAPLRQISTMLAAIILPSVQKLPQGYDSATPSKMWPAASIAGRPPADKGHLCPRRTEVPSAILRTTDRRPGSPAAPKGLIWVDETSIYVPD